MTTGTDIIGELLLADPDFMLAVPASSVKAGRLPDDTPLPAVLVRTISSTERQVLTIDSYQRVTERVSVTVRAANYRDQNSVIKLIRDACRGRTGNIGGADQVSVLTSGKGPDLNGPGNTFEQAQDFRVSYNEFIT